MTYGYLSKDREHLATMQRQRRAQMVRIDYMPGKAARDAIEAMRALSRPGSVSATNSAVIDAIVTDWARLTGINYIEIVKPKTPARQPVLSDQYARACMTSANLANRAHDNAGASLSAGVAVPTSRARVGAGSTSVRPELFDTSARANNSGSLSAGVNQARVICGARRRRDGQPCQGLSVPGKRRCKWHGGASTGPKTEAGKKKSQLNLSQFRKSSNP